jgi:hypothetical protein
VSDLLDEYQLVCLRESVRYAVAGGYKGRDEIVEAVAEVFADQAADRAVLVALAERLTDDKLAAHLARQAQWPATTDNDRLAAAFTALQGSGIVARENFSCCTACGVAAIWGALNTPTGRARGFTFFHSQDTEKAVDGYGLYLAYGAIAEGEQAAVTVGTEIVAALRDQGLAPHWDGQWPSDIVVPMHWRRRRT